MNLFEQASVLVRHGGLVLDIGCGIRPQTLVRADSHVCVDPHAPYLDVVISMGYRAVHKTAEQALSETEPVDTVVMLDVIEHMEREEGERTIALAMEKSDQVVVFTPLGYVPQSGDAWRMGGEHWQEHRSGWKPEDFEGWHVLVDRRFHKWKRAGAFFAVWQR